MMPVICDFCDALVGGERKTIGALIYDGYPCDCCGRPIARPGGQPVSHDLLVGMKAALVKTREIALLRDQLAAAQSRMLKLSALVTDPEKRKEVFRDDDEK